MAKLHQSRQSNVYWMDLGNPLHIPLLWKYDGLLQDFKFHGAKKCLTISNLWHLGWNKVKMENQQNLLRYAIAHAFVRFYRSIWFCLWQTCSKIIIFPLHVHLQTCVNQIPAILERCIWNDLHWSNPGVNMRSDCFRCTCVIRMKATKQCDQLRQPEKMRKKNFEGQNPRYFSN